MPEVALSPVLPTDSVIFRSSGSVYTSSDSSAVTVMVVSALHSLTRVGLMLKSTFVLTPASLSVMATDVPLTVALAALPSTVSDSDAPSYNVSSTGVRVNLPVADFSPDGMEMVRSATVA